VEEHAEAIYGQTGGCWVGRNSWLSQEWTWPFAGLYIYRDELVLSMSFRRYSFTRADISLIHRYYRGLRCGLQIEHANRDIPRFIVFWPRDAEEFEDALNANAFPVATRSV
jgi:hypothetical protein